MAVLTGSDAVKARGERERHSVVGLTGAASRTSAAGGAELLAM
jgi:hypothetical protein